jgi:4,5-DOPA dioxygenase extradiol
MYSDPVSLFISHGSPMLAVERNAFTDGWVRLAAELPRPQSILVLSAHWDSPSPIVSAAPSMETIHDFGGFPEALYREQYPAPGAPGLAARVASLVPGCKTDARRGLDHGAWVPLKLMYPDADIPVTQLSIQSRLDATHHYQLGQQLAPLRKEGVLVMGSGGIVHNLRELDWHGAGNTHPWAKGFNDWMAEKAAAGDLEALLDYARRAPEPRLAHPTPEHLVPFFAALGAGGFPSKQLALGFDLGSLGMDCFLFG